jgi:hypothetical protein
VLTIETIKTQLEAAETAADRRTLSSLVTKILNDWLKAIACEPGEQISMIAKVSALLFFALLIAIAVVVFGRLSKRLVFDFRATVLSVILATLALIYLRRLGLSCFVHAVTRPFAQVIILSACRPAPAPSRAPV